MIKLTRWGNSTGLRLPACLLEAAGLKPGSYVTARLLNSGEIRIKPWGHVQSVEEGAGEESTRVMKSKVEQW